MLRAVIAPLRPSNLPSCQAGNVAVMFAILLPVIVGGAGLGVETTYWRYQQVRLQAAADAAAYAGSIEKRAGASEAAVSQAVSVAAAQNGFEPTQGTTEIQSPATVGGASNPNALAVTLRMEAPRFFTAVFDSSPIDLRARAVAVFQSSSAVCVLALDPSSPQAIVVSGSADVTMQGCNMMANSIADNAIVLQGNSELTAPCLISVGGAVNSGTLNLTACSSINLGAPRAADPYRDLAAPADTGDCLTPSANLQPGHYCNGLQLHGDVTLQPGVYVVSGGEMRINATAHVEGSGVTIYLKGTSRLQVDGSADVVLSAPTSGDYSGILFFGDRASLGGSNIFNGTASSRMTGALYFPSQAVEYKGNFSGENGCTQVIARTVEWTGNTSVSVDCTSLGMQTVPSTSVVKLVE